MYIYSRLRKIQFLSFIVLSLLVLTACNKKNGDNPLNQNDSLNKKLYSEIYFAMLNSNFEDIYDGGLRLVYQTSAYVGFDSLNVKLKTNYIGNYIANDINLIYNNSNLLGNNDFWRYEILKYDTTYNVPNIFGKYGKWGFLGNDSLNIPKFTINWYCPKPMIFETNLQKVILDSNNTMFNNIYSSISLSTGLKLKWEIDKDFNGKILINFGKMANSKTKFLNFFEVLNGKIEYEIKFNELNYSQSDTPFRVGDTLSLTIDKIKDTLIDNKNQHMYLKYIQTINEKILITK